MARFSTLIFLFLMASFASAEDQPLWKEVGGWDIRIDTTLDNGCFTYQSYEGDVFVRVGVNTPDGGMYVMVGDADWKSLEVGKEYPIKLYFGNETPWSGDAAAVDFGIPILMLNVAGDSASTFIRDFMHETSLKIEYENKSIAHLSLKGTYKAGLEVLECQKQVNDATGKSDPFDSPINSPHDADDPFAT